VTAPYDLPPIPDELNADPRFKHDMISHVRAYALAAIAPYKAEIERLRQQLGQPLETERENAKLRELLNELWSCECYGWEEDLPDRIHAALGEKK
jgi:hypothetical protein